MGHETTTADVRETALAIGWPPNEVNDRLKQWVIRLWPGAESVDDLSEEQRAIFTGQLLAGAGCELPTIFRPRRRGQAGYRPNAHEPVTRGQIIRVNILAGELGWSRSLLVRFLRRFFRVDRLADLSTKRAADTALKQLAAYKLKRDRRREAGSAVF